MTRSKRFVFGCAFGVLAISSAWADPAPKDARSPRGEGADKTSTLKPRPANSCAQYGAGFVRLGGSDTCVQIGGSIGIGVGASR